jgi:hypothetical protein
MVFSQSANVSKHIGFYLDELLFPRLAVSRAGSVNVLRIGQKLACFRLPNINRPIMFCDVIFFEHGLLSIRKYVQTH